MHNSRFSPTYTTSKPEVYTDPARQQLRDQIAEMNKQIEHLNSIKSMASGDEGKSDRRRLRREIAELNEQITERETLMRSLPREKHSATHLMLDILNEHDAMAQAFTAMKEKFLQKISDDPTDALLSYTDDIIKAQTLLDISRRFFYAIDRVKQAQGPLTLALTIGITQSIRESLTEDLIRSHRESRSSNIVYEVQTTYKNYAIAEYLDGRFDAYQVALSYMEKAAELIQFDELEPEPNPESRSAQPDIL